MLTVITIITQKAAPLPITGERKHAADVTIK